MGQSQSGAELGDESDGIHEDTDNGSDPNGATVSPKASGGSALASASVVLCTRNRAARISSALQALAAMRVGEHIDWEVLIVDNGSTDSTRDTVQAFIRNGHGRFRYTYEPVPGKTFALNRGLREARGEVLAFTDDDALVAPNWLAAIVDSLEQHEADGVGGKVLPIWEGARPDWLSDRFLNVLALLDYGDKAFPLNWKTAPFMLYGVNFAFRKTVFELLGGFNTILGSRGEDQELFDRLSASDACVYYDPDVIVSHMIPPERLTKAYYRSWYRASGRVRAMLSPPKGRQIFGIPIFSMRQGLAALGNLLKSILVLDKEGVFEHSLRIQYLAAYYAGRLRSTMSHVPSDERG